MTLPDNFLILNVTRPIAKKGMLLKTNMSCFLRKYSLCFSSSYVPWWANSSLIYRLCWHLIWSLVLPASKSVPERTFAVSHNSALIQKVQLIDILLCTYDMSYDNLTEKLYCLVCCKGPLESFLLFYHVYWVPYPMSIISRHFLKETKLELLSTSMQGVWQP